MQRTAVAKAVLNDPRHRPRRQARNAGDARTGAVEVWQQTADGDQHYTARERDGWVLDQCAGWQRGDQGLEWRGKRAKAQCGVAGNGEQDVTSAEHPRASPSTLTRATRASRSSSQRLRSRPPPYPTSEPPAPISRWHGMTIEIGLRPFASPTARAADGRLRRAASWP